EVAGVHVRGERRLVLAAQDCCCVRSEAAENHVGGVDDDPVTLDLPGLRGECARHNSAAFLIRTERFVNPTPGWFSVRSLSLSKGRDGNTPVEGSRSSYRHLGRPKGR